MQLTQYSQFIIPSEVAFLQWGKIVILLNRYTTAMQSNCSCYLKKKTKKIKNKNKKNLSRRIETKTGSIGVKHVKTCTHTDEKQFSSQDNDVGKYGTFA